MKCPKCRKELVPDKRHGIQVDFCPSCRGMWLDPQELDELEDVAFDADEMKGTVMALAAPSALSCPHCNKPLSKFHYRFYDLALDYCPEHGYWLDENEDNRILELMRREKGDLEHKSDAEAKWGAMLEKWRHPTFLSKLKNLFK